MSATGLKFAVGLAGISCAIAFLTAFALPFHILRFYIGIPVLTINTYLLYISTETGGLFNRICSFSGFGRGDSEACRKLDGHASLEEVQSFLCTDAAKTALGGHLCDGYANAYALGVALIFGIVFLFAGHGVGAWLSLRYLEQPKKKYRELAFILMASGSMLHFIPFILYAFIVLMDLDSMTLSAGIGSILTNSSGIGTTWGCWLSVIVCILNIVVVLLVMQSKLSAEDELMEMRRQREFDNEIQEQHYGGYCYDMATHSNAGAYAGAAGGHHGQEYYQTYNQPYSQPASQQMVPPQAYSQASAAGFHMQVQVQGGPTAQIISSGDFGVGR